MPDRGVGLDDARVTFCMQPTSPFRGRTDVDWGLAGCPESRTMRADAHTDGPPLYGLSYGSGFRWTGGPSGHTPGVAEA